MKRYFLTGIVALLGCTGMTHATEYYGLLFGDMEVTSDNMEDIFGDGKAVYDPEFNTLFLEDGFSYSLSKGFVSIETEQEEFAIRLEGNAEIKAAVKSTRAVRITSDADYTLRITSNISGSALQCPSLFIGKEVTLNLLSRNSQQDMYALDCGGTLEMWSSTLNAEVTTASLAVKVAELDLHNCSLLKPKGGALNAAWGGICFGDGLPAKIVHIAPDTEGIDQANSQEPTANSQKLFHDGQLLIERNGKTFNATGTQVK